MICYMYLYVFLISSQQDRLASHPGSVRPKCERWKVQTGIPCLRCHSLQHRREALCAIKLWMLARCSSWCLQDACKMLARCLQGRAKTQIYTDLIWSYESYMIKLWWISNSLKGGWVCIFMEGLDTLGSRVLRQLALHCHCCHAEGQR